MVFSRRNKPMAVAAKDIHRWTRKNYERMAIEGLFAPDARVELIDGIVYDKAPQSAPHVSGVHRTLKALERVFPDSYIRVHAPLALADDSEPEPDLAVIQGTILDYAVEHPTTALLVVEIADSSLAHDQGLKIRLYARCGIPEAWLLNVPAKTLEVYRDPVEDVYRTRQILRTGETVSPLVRPEAQIAVSDLFPS
jgi:Uma2 family endonuclease